MLSPIYATALDAATRAALGASLPPGYAGAVPPMPSNVVPPPDPALPDPTVAGPIDVMPGTYAAPPVTPGALVDRFRAGLPAGATDGHLYLWDKMAGGGSLDRQGLDAMTDHASQGLHFSQVLDGRTQANLQAAADDMTGKTAHLDDDEFESLLGQLRGLGANPPPPAPHVALQGPGLAQLGVAGLASLLVPRLALQSLAAPFQAQLQRQAQDQQMADQQAALAQHGYAQRIDATKGALDAEQRHEGIADNIAARETGRKENIASRQFIADQQEKARLLGDLHDAGDNAPKLHAAFAALDGGGFGKYVPQSTRDALLGAAKESSDAKADEKRRQKDEDDAQHYLQIAYAAGTHPGDRTAAAHMAQSLIARNRPDDPRLAQIDRDMAGMVAPSPEQVDGHNKAVATIAHLAAQTATENATRQGKVQALLDGHDYKGAQIAATQAQTELAKTRNHWMAPEQAARIALMQADAARARAAAISTAQGQASRPSNKIPVLEKTDVSLSNAVRKTQDEIDSLKGQQSILRAMSNVSAATGMDHSADLDRLSALIVARQADHDRLDGYRQENLQRLAQARAAANAGMVGNIGPVVPGAPGATVPGGPGRVLRTVPAAPPSGWSIKRKG